MVIFELVAGLGFEKFFECFRKIRILVGVRKTKVNLILGKALSPQGWGYVTPGLTFWSS